jgi:deoxyribodipyrimidine photolyase-related protein
MTSIRFVFWDQLSHSISSLSHFDKSQDIVFMCEVLEEAKYVKHHKKKIAFLFSAMRHFAQELKNKGYCVEYITLCDKENTGTSQGELQRAIKRYNPKRIVVTFPGEYRVFKKVELWESEFGIPVEIYDDDRFLCKPKDFSIWAKARKQIRMEFFYREMRKKYNILMDDGKPIGGKWNYDILNRKVPKIGLAIPKVCESKPDITTIKVINLVNEYFNDHFGDIRTFHFAVTRENALIALKHFIEKSLSYFGDYQDGMLQGEPWLFHSHLSFYLNCGLLLPLECVLAAEKAYYEKKAPLNSVEGFIRQIIGWREYIRGVYWLKMPQYSEENFFKAKKKMPDFYWTAKTRMNCLKQCVLETKENAYAHHIQRLMVLGNFALISGLDPKEVNNWYLTVYADAHEWVELPNVSGMVLFADGGFLSSKPYAASGSYINKMSDYCKSCAYDVNKKNGPDACPFNYLYWNFLVSNQKTLSKNNRMKMIYKIYERMDDERKEKIYEDSKNFLGSLNI